MNVFESILFGLLQGLTEFLPVSSSGHLVVLKELLDLSEVSVLFDILLHIATLAAVCVVFRKKIFALIASAWRFICRKNSEDDQNNLVYILAIFLGSVVTVGVALIVRKLVPDPPIKLVSVFFLVSASILFVGFIAGRYHAKKGISAESRPVRLRDGLVTGFAQGLGVFPGISRSGITISAALATGVPREHAGELSFLLSIPAIIGAFILELKDADTLIAQVEILPLVIGSLVAFVSGLLALKVLLHLVRRGNLVWFALWLVPLGLSGLFLF